METTGKVEGMNKTDQIRRSGEGTGLKVHSVEEMDDGRFLVETESIRTGSRSQKIVSVSGGVVGWETDTSFMDDLDDRDAELDEIRDREAVEVRIREARKTLLGEVRSSAADFTEEETTWQEFGSPWNGRKMERRLIGFYQVEVWESRTHNPTEMPWFWLSVEMAPGFYPMYETRGAGAKGILSISLRGVVTAAYTRRDDEAERGKIVEFSGRPYAYAVARDLLENPDSPYLLLDGIEARYIDFEYEGEARQTTGLFLAGEEVAR